ncbi:MAG: hypothetical protein AAF967_11700 [Pseudomonadota bacterium]
MTAPRSPAQDFIRLYESQFSQYQADANLAKTLISEITDPTGIMLYGISARAKTPASLRGKLRRKNYEHPEKDITDLVGIRIVTFYHDDIDAIVRHLRRRLDINKKDSIDKRSQLGLREFGYRSVQLVARPNPKDVQAFDFQVLQGRWFEIQVRSVLEHAWAEIEHKIIYKAKIKYPEDVVRRFASLAGTIEILDDEFVELKKKRNEFIGYYREHYKKDQDDLTPFDVARLLGFLEACRPKGRSWRQAEAAGAPFQAGLDASCVEALSSVGLGTPNALRGVFTSSKFRRISSRFAAARDIAPKEISHPAAVVLALIVTDASAIGRHFPEVLFDQTIRDLIDSVLAR